MVEEYKNAPSAQSDWTLAITLLSNDPPNWLKEVLACSAHLPAKDVNDKRMREWVWSRGMLHCLVLREASRWEGNPATAMISSIAHDRMQVAVLYGHGDRAGVDIEQRRGRASALRIANSWFPPCEYAEIANCSDPEQRFLVSWTLKEAWAKYARRSIFDACQKVAFYDGVVHTDTFDRCAFASAHIATSVVGVCVEDASHYASRAIRSVVPTITLSDFTDLQVEWCWHKQKMTQAIHAS